MLRFLYLTAVLPTVFIPFLPEVAFGLPRRVLIIDDSPTEIVEPNNNCRRVIVDPITNSRTVIVEPTNNCRRVIVEPTNNSRTVMIVDPTKENPTFQQPGCGSMIFGSPIPSPVPVDPNTGLRCQ